MTAPTNEITYVRPAVIDVQKNGMQNLVSPAATFTGLAAIDAMPLEEYRTRFNNEPGFKEKVDALESARKVSPKQYR